MSQMSLLGITQLKAQASKKWSWLGRDSGELPEYISLCPAVPVEQDRRADRLLKRCSVSGPVSEIPVKSAQHNAAVLDGPQELASHCGLSINEQ